MIFLATSSVRLFEHEGPVEVLLVVDAVLDQLAVLVASCPARGASPSRSLSRSMRTTL